MAKCGQCNGTGKVELKVTSYAIEEKICYICKGSGTLTPCPQCTPESRTYGLGRVDGGKCPGCDDKGIARYYYRDPPLLQGTKSVGGLVACPKIAPVARALVTFQADFLDSGSPPTRYSHDTMRTRHGPGAGSAFDPCSHSCHRPTTSGAVSHADGLILATQHRERLTDDARQQAASSQARPHAPR
jgi:hypothetical protein